MVQKIRMERTRFLLSQTHRHLLPALALSFSLVLVSSCATTQTSYLKGVTSDGAKVYSGPSSLVGIDAYRNYYYSQKTEAEKLDYLFRRLKMSKELIFHHDGKKYNWLECYRAGMWLLRHRYEQGSDAREFIKDYVWYSEETGKANLVEFPDGSIHEGYYILINELDLLEESIAKDVSPD
jgi:hypothetical protein